MSRINISEFDLKLGFNGKEVNKGLDKLEKRLSKMDKTMDGAAKLAAQNAKIQNQLLKQKKNLALADLKIAKQKAALDLQSAKSATARAKAGTASAKRRLADMKAEAAVSKAKLADTRAAEASDKRRSSDALQKQKQITAAAKEAERAKTAAAKESERARTAEAKEIERVAAAEARAADLAEKRARAAERTARASERTSRSSGRTSRHLRNSVRSSGNLSGNLAKGALAFGAAYGITSASASTVRTGVDYTRERTGLESVLEELARKMNIADEKGFSRKYVQFAKQTALDMNRSITDTTKSLRNVLAANIGVITRGGQNSFDGVIDTFTGFTKAGAYSKSTKDEMRLMFRAITQSSQKGKLQAEEVTGQLAERSPFAMQALVKSFQKFKKDTTLIEKDFFKAMKNGELLAEDILPEAGRQIGFIIDDLTGSDLKKFLESSTAGTFAGLQTAVEGQQINIFDKMDKSLSRLLKSLSHFIRDMDWITKPMGTYVGNLIDYADEDLKKIHRDMKSGTGFWGDIASFFGIHNYETFEMITSQEGGATPEQQKVASESLAKSSRSLYDNITEFGGGFLTGFVDTLKAIVKQVKALAEAMGLLEEGETWNPENIGKVLGSLEAMKFTGLLNVLEKLITVMPMLLKFATNPKVARVLAVLGSGALGWLIGDTLNEPNPETGVSVTGQTAQAAIALLFGDTESAKESGAKALDAAAFNLVSAFVSLTGAERDKSSKPFVPYEGKTPLRLVDAGGGLELQGGDATVENLLDIMLYRILSGTGDKYNEVSILSLLRRLGDFEADWSAVLGNRSPESFGIPVNDYQSGYQVYKQMHEHKLVIDLNKDGVIDSSEELLFKEKMENYNKYMVLGGQ